jgi:DHA3 family macrolide efflux protein-like MFS transporter
MAMLLNFLLVPASSFQPLGGTKIFNKGGVELGWAETVFGVGMIAGGLLLGAWGGFKRKILTSLMGILGISLGVILIGIAPADMFFLMLAANFILGVAQVLANGPLGAIFQSSIDHDMQGRVFSLINAGATAMMPLSLLIAGPVSDWLGLRVWYLVGGGLCIVVVLVGVSIPAILNIEEQHSAASSSADPVP